eukprot:GHVL01042684.1.p1 GENE.GHVL01042684.1~~GHVL01042684.1.p1  ORF type:complete len:902 (+),score=254.48 GHVL01042684.1:24-2708(+)
MNVDSIRSKYQKNENISSEEWMYLFNINDDNINDYIKNDKNLKKENENIENLENENIENNENDRTIDSEKNVNHEEHVNNVYLDEDCNFLIANNDVDHIEYLKELCIEYCYRYNIVYFSGLANMMRIILLFNIDRSDILTALYFFIKNFIHKNMNKLIDQVIKYHNPWLGVHLEKIGVSSSTYSYTWVNLAFSKNYKKLDDIYDIWKKILLSNEQSTVILLFISFLLSKNNELLSIINKKNAIKCISLYYIPDNINDWYNDTIILSLKTPKTVSKDIINNEKIYQNSLSMKNTDLAQILKIRLKYMALLKKKQKKIEKKQKNDEKNEEVASQNGETTSGIDHFNLGGHDETPIDTVRNSETMDFWDQEIHQAEKEKYEKSEIYTSLGIDIDYKPVEMSRLKLYERDANLWPAVLFDCRLVTEKEDSNFSKIEHCTTFLVEAVIRPMQDLGAMKEELVLMSEKVRGNPIILIGGSDNSPGLVGISALLLERGFSRVCHVRGSWKDLLNTLRNNNLEKIIIVPNDDDWFKNGISSQNWQEKLSEQVTNVTERTARVAANIWSEVKEVHAHRGEIVYGVGRRHHGSVDYGKPVTSTEASTVNSLPSNPENLVEDSKSKSMGMWPSFSKGKASLSQPSDSKNKEKKKKKEKKAITTDDDVFEIGSDGDDLSETSHETEENSPRVGNMMESYTKAIQDIDILRKGNRIDLSELKSNISDTLVFECYKIREKNTKWFGRDMRARILVLSLNYVLVMMSDDQIACTSQSSNGSNHIDDETIEFDASQESSKPADKTIDSKTSTKNQSWLTGLKKGMQGLQMANMVKNFKYKESNNYYIKSNHKLGHLQKVSFSDQRPDRITLVWAKNNVTKENIYQVKHHALLIEEMRSRLASLMIVMKQS